MTEDAHSGTPVRLNVSQAAKAVHKARSTLNRDIANGKVSVSRDGKGQPFIDIAELERVYGNVDSAALSDPVRNGHLRTPKNPSSDSVISKEVEFLREKLADYERMQDRERRHLQDTIDDLRRRLDKADEERRVAQAQVTALLTDQRTANRPPWWRFWRTASP